MTPTPSGDQRRSTVARTLGNLALVAGSVACGLLLLDLVYRFTQPPDIVPRELGRYDSILGWALTPGATSSSRATGRKIEYRINSHGARGPETSYAKPPGVFRIVLLGDSRTFGYGVEIGQHFSQLLPGYFKDVEVINLGVSGFGVDQELLMLRSEGLRYQPDVVIAYVAHFGDERHMFAERFGRQKPLFRVQDSQLVLTNVPVPREYQGLDLPHRLDRYLSLRSPLYRDGTQAVFRLLRGTAAPPPAPAAAKAARDTAFESRMYRTATVILEEMRTEAGHYGANFLLVTQLPRLHAACAGEGIHSLDLWLPLANRRFDLPNGLAHVNEAGNGVLAWEISRYLDSAGLIPPSHRRDTTWVEPPS